MARKRRKPEGVEEAEEPVTRAMSARSGETGPDSAGQSGDLQGLSDVEGEESESVLELIEEGQYFEASVVSGVEDAALADSGPVKTHEVPEDDIPPEYVDQDRDEPKE